MGQTLFNFEPANDFGYGHYYLEIHVGPVWTTMSALTALSFGEEMGVVDLRSGVGFLGRVAIECRLPRPPMFLELENSDHC